MNKRLVSSLAVAALFAVSSAAFATNSGEDGHQNQNGQGHSEHGQGNGYGHDKGDGHNNPGNGGGNHGNSGGTGGQGGGGGKGGAGGSANQLQGQGQELNAKLSASATGVGTGIAESKSIAGAAATGGDAKATGGQGGTSGAAAGANASGNGNGGGATVGFTDNSSAKYTTVVLPPAPEAPLSMAIGNIATTKMGVCGPRFNIQENADEVIQTTPGVIFGLGADYATVRTMHGRLVGLNKDAFIEQTTGEFDDNGNPIKVVRLWGHQLVMVASVTGTSAGSGVGASGSNSAGAASIGLSNGAGAALPGVLVTAMPCVYKAYTVKPAPVPPVVVPPVCVKANGKPCVQTTLVPAN